MSYSPTQRWDEIERRSLAVGWRWMAVGGVLALVFTLTPTLGFMGWLLGSLFHETGHVAFAWYVGCPAWPAISLTGHAAAFHKPQSDMIVMAMGVFLVVGALFAYKHDRFKPLAFGLLAAWPIFTFFETPRALGFLLSGHMGELVFAGIFLWRARTGEDITHEGERPLYACLGWFLVARNVALCGGLVFSASARATYMGNGSFGLMNDYARIAHNVLGMPLQAVAVFMLLVALAVFPIVLAMTWRPERTAPFPEAPRARAYEPPPAVELDRPRAPAAPPEKRVIPISKVKDRTF